MKTDIKSCGRLMFDDVTIAKLRIALKERYKINEVNVNDLNYGLKIDVVGSDSFNFIHEAIIKLSNVSRDSLIELERNSNTKTYSVIYFPEKDVVLKKKLKRNKLAQ